MSVTSDTLKVVLSTDIINEKLAPAALVGALMVDNAREVTDILRMQMKALAKTAYEAGMSQGYDCGMEAKSAEIKNSLGITSKNRSISYDTAQSFARFYDEIRSVYGMDPQTDIIIQSHWKPPYYVDYGD